ncbi:flagellar biosynthesis protein FlhA [Endozoicomonas sp. SCSIO W0465]|uniref:flagellar biosynthesis protein FlhA n=1 Tax=Endozoicomonas sp. SCSIO W0465 TaxID=2918516 RepID=UPI00207564E0|nr:flagellar biosynthesis protein FlhA [Endozoicomonas sp. SCSIO W0465]USE38247.1 flagellar biosynthesis protein FlhA [Endozoicomonas sp. SCSIO W0465]
MSSNTGLLLPTSPKPSLLATPLLLLVVLAMLMLPIPPFLLDFLFSFNITLSLILLILTIYINRPLDFSLFPTLLLVATLLRLALNIASTRVVLIYGHDGPYAAGKVIEAFGNVVIAGNYFVGLLVFLILVIVNFVVITKGGSRISEVTARFVLDSMPGKQMAIDADLNSGVIDHNEARLKREDITREADFYGAMDGASKFVRGDAIAGLMILLINILGGVTIGIWQYDMSLTEATQLYGLMTIGDGLVAQIPSLLLSTAAAIMVTRISGAVDMNQQVRQEIIGQPKALMVAAAVLVVIGLVPGMPHVAFVIPGLLMVLFIYRRISVERRIERDKVLDSKDDESSITSRERLTWQDISVIDPIGLNIGYRVISLLSPDNPGANGELAMQIRHLRREVSEQYGFLIPMIHLRDNLNLDPDSYSIQLHNVAVDHFTLHIDHLLAIAMENARPLPFGPPVKDPSYGLTAYWIPLTEREASIQAGYTVVDCSTVITTHVGKVIENHVDELFGFEETQGWLAHLRQISPKLCDELVPDKLPPGMLMQVLKRLLTDNISIADSPRIAATLLATTEPQQDILALVRQVRITLRRQIIEPLINHQSIPEQLAVFTLSHELEKMLLLAREQAKRDPQFSEASFVIEPSLSMQLQNNIPELIRQAHNKQVEPVLLVAPQLWPLLSRYRRIAQHRSLTILTFQEIPDDLQVEIIGQLG